MNQIRPWLTVKQAAFLVGRSATQVYAWIRADKVETRVDEHGVTLVGHLSLMRAEAAMKRGRPRIQTKGRSG